MITVYEENIDYMGNHTQSLGGVLFFKVCMDEIPQYLRSTYEQFSVDLNFNDISLSIPINFEYEKKEQKIHILEKKYLKSVQTSKISKDRKKNPINSRNNIVDQYQYEGTVIDSVSSLDNYRNVFESESITLLNLKVMRRIKNNEKSIHVSTPLPNTCIDDVCREISDNIRNDNDIHGVPLSLILVDGAFTDSHNTINTFNNITGSNDSKKSNCDKKTINSTDTRNATPSV